jgi:effector-binding domain-containing protein
MPAAAIDGWLPAAYQRVADALARQGAQPSGPPFARYTRQGELIEVEAGFAVDNAIVDDGDVVASGLPGGPAAVATCAARAARADVAYRAVDRWLNRHGFAAVGPHWEYYERRTGTERDPSRWRTEIVVPYRWHLIGARA